WRRRFVIRRSSWKWIAAVLAAVAVIWLLYHAVSARRFDWRLAASSLTHLRLPWVILAFGFVYATYWGRAVRWAVFLKPLKPHPSFANLLSATIIGFTAITLLGRPGEFVRPYLIAIKEKVPVASQFAAWVLERIADLLMVLLLFGFALARIASTGLAVGPKLAPVLGVGGRLAIFAGAALILLLFFFRHFTQAAQRGALRLLGFLPNRFEAGVEKLLSSFFEGVQAIKSDGALLMVLAYSVLEWLLIAAVYWSLVESFTDFHLNGLDVIIFIAFTALGASIQIPGVGGGSQVMAALVLTELFGVRLETATAFAFFLWILTFLAVVPVGLFLSMKEGLKFRKLRQIRAVDYS
ncbi:MAG: flippase-like domain-containing protein, partial [Acidobacteriia bacterium]|nr:flippase-like domain-containing protein [Terriglobia bacterium]